MRVRDIAIVCIAIIACIIGWSQEGAVNLQNGFQIVIEDEAFHLQMMPKPLIVDPVGRNRPLLLTTPSSYKLGVYETHLVRRNLENSFVPLHPRHTEAFGYPILGFSAGLKKPDAPEKAVAVVTSDYTLHLLSMNADGSLQLQWRATIQPFEGRSYTLHASVFIGPERAYMEDVGIVVVSIRARLAFDAEATLFVAFNADNGEERWRIYSDSGNEMDDVLREMNTSQPTSSPLGDAELPLPGIRQVADEHHAQLYRRHERPWTSFREAVMAALPHHYAHPWDNKLHSHIIYPTKGQQDPRTGRKKNGKGVTMTYEDHVIHMNSEDRGLLGETLAAWRRKDKTSGSGAKLSKNKPRQRKARPMANALVHHSRHGIEVLHLYTGRVLTSVEPLKTYNTYYHDVNDDFRIESVATQIGPRVSTYDTHGVDMHLDCLGVVTTDIPVTQDPLYSATICDTQGFFHNLDLIHHFLDGETTLDRSRASTALELLGSTNVVSKSTRAVMPIVVQTHTTQGNGLLRVERFPIFMIDSGLVTCLDVARQRVKWRTATMAEFSDLQEHTTTEGATTAGYADDDDRDHRVRPFPHLAAYSLHQPSLEDDVALVRGGNKRYRRTDPFVLAVGETVLSVLNTKNGDVLRNVKLAAAPVAPVIVADFNGDGTNDIIVVTATSIYGLLGSTQASTNTITSLMVLVVAVLLVLFAARETALATNVDGAAADGGEAALAGTTADMSFPKPPVKRASD